MPHTLKTLLISKSLEWGGVSWEVYGVGQGFNNDKASGSKSYSVLLKGPSYEGLENNANLLKKILSGNNRVSNVNSNQSLDNEYYSTFKYVYQLNPQSTRTSAISGGVIGNVLSQYLSPSRTSSMFYFNQIFLPVVINDLNFEKHTISDIEQILVASPYSVRSRIGVVSDVYTQQSSNSIYKLNKQYLRLLTLTYTGPPKMGEKFLAQCLLELESEMKIGYTATVQNRGATNTASNTQFLIATTIIIFLLFAICVIFTENLKAGFLAIGAMCFSFLGIFLVFGSGRIAFDSGGYASFFVVGPIAAYFMTSKLCLASSRNRKPGRGS